LALKYNHRRTHPRKGQGRRGRPWKSNTDKSSLYQRQRGAPSGGGGGTVGNENSKKVAVKVPVPAGGLESNEGGGKTGSPLPARKESPSPPYAGPNRDRETLKFPKKKET